MNRRRRLTNTSEARVLHLLREATDGHNANVMVKVGLKDALDINNSGISSQEYTYALMAHLDFVITDSDQQVLFAVEYDGPCHLDVETIKRDRMKNSLCERLGLPLIRVGNRSMQHVKKLQLIRWLTLLYFNTEKAYANLPFAEASQGLQNLIKQQAIFSADGESPTAAIHDFANIMYEAWVFVWDRNGKCLYGTACFQRFPNFAGVDASQLAVSVAEYALWLQVKAGMRFQYSDDDIVEKISNRLQEAKRYEKILSCNGISKLPQPEWELLVKSSAVNDEE